VRKAAAGTPAVAFTLGHDVTPDVQTLLGVTEGRRTLGKFLGAENAMSNSQATSLADPAKVFVLQASRGGVDGRQLEAAVEALKKTLRGSLIATDIWDREAYVSLAAHNSRAEAVSLFTHIANSTDEKLAQAGFPGVDHWYMNHLKGGLIGLVVYHGDDILQGILIDTAKANIGVLVSVAVPQMLTMVQAARIR
jgi:hypothetical protein